MPWSSTSMCRNNGHSLPDSPPARDSLVSCSDGKHCTFTPSISNCMRLILIPFSILDNALSTALFVFRTKEILLFFGVLAFAGNFELLFVSKFKDSRGILMTFSALKVSTSENWPLRRFLGSCGEQAPDGQLLTASDSPSRILSTRSSFCSSRLRWFSHSFCPPFL